MVATVDALMERKKVSLAEIVSKSGLHPDRVEAIVLGRWLPSPEEREAIAGALNVKVDEIDWGHSLNPRLIRYRQFGLREEF